MPGNDTTDVGLRAVLGVDIDEGEARQAKRKLEEEVGDVQVGVDGPDRSGGGLRDRLGSMAPSSQTVGKAGAAGMTGLSLMQKGPMGALKTGAAGVFGHMAGGGGVPGLPGGGGGRDGPPPGTSPTVPSAPQNEGAMTDPASDDADSFALDEGPRDLGSGKSLVDLAIDRNEKLQEIIDILEDDDGGDDSDGGRSLMRMMGMGIAALGIGATLLAKWGADIAAGFVDWVGENLQWPSLPDLEIDIPEIPVPDIPELEVPEIPDLGIPDSIPELGIPDSIPELGIPDNIPDLGVPEFPDVSIPAIDDLPSEIPITGISDLPDSIPVEKPDWSIDVPEPGWVDDVIQEQTGEETGDDSGGDFGLPHLLGAGGLAGAAGWLANRGGGGALSRIGGGAASFATPLITDEMMLDEEQAQGNRESAREMTPDFMDPLFPEEGFWEGDSDEPLLFDMMELFGGDYDDDFGWDMSEEEARDRANRGHGNGHSQRDPGTTGDEGENQLSDEQLEVYVDLLSDIDISLGDLDGALDEMKQEIKDELQREMERELRP